MNNEGRTGGLKPAPSYEPSVRRSEPVRVPETLVSSAAADSYEYVVLGAGCAGLSLCYYLLQSGVEAPILILDRKTRFEDDRTWCFWDVEDTPFSHLETRRWNSWSVHYGARDVLHTSQSYSYRCITAASFYEFALNSIAKHANVTLRLGADVEGFEERDAGTHIRAADRTYTARYVFDGRGLPPGSRTFETARREAVWIPQQFIGLRVRTARPVFDPAVCTLMDFSVSQERGLRFMYVLPFGEREALVENVYLSEPGIAGGTYRTEIADYMSDTYGLTPQDYVVDGEERGYIPMTDYPFPRRIGERIYSIGMLGGQTRPSTGYTFLRIQRYCRALARHLTAEGPAPRAEFRRFDVLDRVFLRFMRRYPERCPSIYARMYGRVPPGSLVRFLTEKSTPADELSLVMALPKIPFLRVAGGALFEKFTGL